MEKCLENHLDKDSHGLLQNRKDLTWLRGLQKVTKERQNYCTPTLDDVCLGKSQIRSPVESLSMEFVDAAVQVESYFADFKPSPLCLSQSEIGFPSPKSSSPNCSNFFKTNNPTCLVPPFSSPLKNSANNISFTINSPATSSRTTTNKRASLLSRDDSLDRPIQDLVSTFCRVSSTPVSPTPQGMLGQASFESFDASQSSHVLSTQVRSCPIEDFEVESLRKATVYPITQETGSRLFLKPSSQRNQRFSQIQFDSQAPPSEPVVLLNAGDFKVEFEQKGKRKNSSDTSAVDTVKRRLDFASFAQVRFSFFFFRVEIHAKCVFFIFSLLTLVLQIYNHPSINSRSANDSVTSKSILVITL